MVTSRSTCWISFPLRETSYLPLISIHCMVFFLFFLSCALLGCTVLGCSSLYCFCTVLPLFPFFLTIRRGRNATTNKTGRKDGRASFLSFLFVVAFLPLLIVAVLLSAGSDRGGHRKVRGGNTGCNGCR